MYTTGLEFKNLELVSNLNAILFHLNIANTPHQKHI